jgi:hydrogenase expression/formation protein HypC
MRWMVCLAVPARLVECKADRATAVADLHGNRVPVSTVLVPDVRTGDWVLIHAGFAIQKLEGDDVRETWALLEDLSGEGAGAP